MQCRCRSQIPRWVWMKPSRESKTHGNSLRRKWVHEKIGSSWDRNARTDFAEQTFAGREGHSNKKAPDIEIIFHGYSERESQKTWLNTEWLLELSRTGNLNIIISIWVKDNNLRLNQSKTREMVICKSPPDYLRSEAGRLNSGSGVTLRSDLRMFTHGDSALSACSSMHGIVSWSAPTSLDQVAKRTTNAQLTYVSPAWRGYTNADETVTIEQLIGLSRQVSTAVAALADEAEQRSFAAIRSKLNDRHVLHGSFHPDRPKTRYGLGSRSHGFQLPEKNDRNFISRVLRILKRVLTNFPNKLARLSPESILP